MATVLPEIETTKRDITNMIIFRIEPELTNEIRSRTLLCDTKELHCKEISTVDFEQNGHNGADYVF